MKIVRIFWILLNGEQHSVTKAMEKTKILDDFFFWLFTSETRLQESQVIETKEDNLTGGGSG